VFLKKATDGLGADVCIDAVGADASGNALHTIFGKKLKLEAGSAVPLHWAINSVKKGGGGLDRRRLLGRRAHGPDRQRREQGPDHSGQPGLREAAAAAPDRARPRGSPGSKAIITHRVPLEDVSDAYHIFSSKLDGCIKPVLLPRAA
jgi:hypothetical protein